MPELALDQKGGLVLLWWVAFEPWANRVTLQSSPPSILSAGRYVHYVLADVGRYLCIGFVLFS